MTVSQVYKELKDAGLLDYLTTGCYYKVATRDEARRS
jgi:DNA-binding transcriptional regulator YhcF (GntR family)